MLKLCQCQNWDMCWFFCPIGSRLSSFSANMTHIFPFLFREMHRPVITLWKKELPEPRCHRCVKYKTMTVGWRTEHFVQQTTRAFRGSPFMWDFPHLLNCQINRKQRVMLCLSPVVYPGSWCEGCQEWEFMFLSWCGVSEPALCDVDRGWDGTWTG